MDRFDVGAWAMVHWIYNTSGDAFAKLVFPGVAPIYHDEKANAWGRSPVRALGMLDDKHRAIVLAAVKEFETIATEQLR